MIEDISKIILKEFRRTAERRNDDPEEALERLVLDYIRGEDIASRLNRIEDRLENTNANPDQEDEDETPEEGKVQALSEYDPSDPKPLSRDALEALPHQRHEEPIIDPSDVTDIPQDVEVKQELILASARYEYDVISQDELAEIADELVSLTSEYKRRTYLEEPWSRCVENGFNFNKAFTSLEAAFRYLEKLASDDKKTCRRTRIDQITEKLYNDYGVSPEQLNEYREVVDLDRFSNS